MRRRWDYEKCLTDAEKLSIRMHQQLADDHRAEYLKHKAQIDRIRRRAAKQARAEGREVRGAA